MKRIARVSLLPLAFALIATAAFGLLSVYQAEAALSLPAPGKFKCPPVKKVPGSPKHSLQIFSLGAPFDSVGIGGPSIEGDAGPAFRNSQGQKTVPLSITALNVTSVVEGIGAVTFWLDSSRPGKSAIWENKPGTDFPASQVMEFNVFVTLEALPGKVFRTVTPASMRSSDVRAFPPQEGATYTMAGPVSLEDADNPGDVVGRVLTGSFVMP